LEKNESEKTLTFVSTLILKEQMLQSEKKIRVSRSVDVIQRRNTITGGLKRQEQSR